LVSQCRANSAWNLLKPPAKREKQSCNPRCCSNFHSLWEPQLGAGNTASAHTKPLHIVK
jgi:hypothetical protein